MSISRGMLHWLTAVSVLAAYLFWLPSSLFEYFKIPGHSAHNLHLSVGIVAFGLGWLAFGRLLSRPQMVLNRGVPRARVVQLALLAMIFILAVTGYVALRQPAFGQKLSLF